jgi:hypothetical protein
MYPKKGIFETVKAPINACNYSNTTHLFLFKCWTKTAQWAVHVSLTFHSVLRKLNTEPFIGASKQVAVHLAKQFQWGKICKNKPAWNKSCLWQPCLLTDGEEISNLYRGPYIDASYQVSIHLVKVVSDEKMFSNRPIRNKNCLWWPFLLMNRDEMSDFYRRHSINVFYLVSVHLAKRFQRRFFQICQSETIITCGGQCLLIDRDKMSNL